MKTADCVPPMTMAAGNPAKFIKDIEVKKENI